MTHHHDHIDKCAPGCDDQLPTIATVGRGPKGDQTYVRIAEPDTCIETYLEGWSVDSATGEVHSQWISENINGGELRYQYNLNPFNVPRTFTITFIYTRPNKVGTERKHEDCSWSWTTPAIPYVWSLDPNGNPDEDNGQDPDHVVGSGVATIFVKTMHDMDWNERLHYPIDPITGLPYDRSIFNAPQAEEGWSATIRFGYNGDVDVPDFDDLAKFIGVPKGDIYQILEGNIININGYLVKDIIDYIDKRIKNLGPLKAGGDPDDPDDRYDPTIYLQTLWEPPVSMSTGSGLTWINGASGGYYYGQAVRVEYHPLTWLVVVKIFSNDQGVPVTEETKNMTEIPLLILPEPKNASNNIRTNLAPIMVNNQYVGDGCELSVDESGLVKLVVNTNERSNIAGARVHGSCVYYAGERNWATLDGPRPIE